jgi:hypothetical protein
VWVCACMRVWVCGCVGVCVRACVWVCKVISCSSISSACRIMMRREARRQKRIRPDIVKVLSQGLRRWVGVGVWVWGCGGVWGCGCVGVCKGVCKGVEPGTTHNNNNDGDVTQATGLHEVEAKNKRARAKHLLVQPSTMKLRSRGGDTQAAQSTTGKVGFYVSRNDGDDMCGGVANCNI